jgi:hypothetical protein
MLQQQTLRLAAQLTQLAHLLYHVTIVPITNARMPPGHVSMANAQGSGA